MFLSLLMAVVSRGEVNVPQGSRDNPEMSRFRHIRTSIAIFSSKFKVSFFFYFLRIL